MVPASFPAFSYWYQPGSNLLYYFFAYPFKTPFLSNHMIFSAPKSWKPSNIPPGGFCFSLKKVALKNRITTASVTPRTAPSSRKNLVGYGFPCRTDDDAEIGAVLWVTTKTLMLIIQPCPYINARTFQIFSQKSSRVEAFKSISFWESAIFAGVQPRN